MTVFCSDIDGTLLNTERTLSARTVRTLRRLVAAGHTFVLCSSRMPASMRILERLYDGRDVPLIAFNGGLVLDAEGRVTIDQRIPVDDARRIYEECARLDVHGSFFSGDDWYAWAEDRWTKRETRNTGVQPRRESAHSYVRSRLDTNPPHKIMCMGEETRIDKIEEVLASSSDLVTYRSKDVYLEIAHAACSKGEAVVAVARDLGVPPLDIVFFGDNYNDLPAFDVVGTSVAVANGRAEVLAAATARTARHHEDGVAQFLEQWLDRQEAPTKRAYSPQARSTPGGPGVDRAP